MKRYWLISLVLLILIAGCSESTDSKMSENNPDKGDVFLTPASSSEVAGALQDPIEFSDIESLIEAINSAKGDYAKEGVVKFGKLEEINTFYKPKLILEGLTFEEIQVRDSYVTFLYSNGELAFNFSWARPFDPKIYLQEAGEKAGTEPLEQNGITYLVTSYPGKDGGVEAYSISWGQHDACFSVYAHAVYDLEMLLTMCDSLPVQVK